MPVFKSSTNATKVAIGSLLFLLAVGAFYTGRHFLAVSNVASAYYAKTLCSGVFVSRRGEKEVIAEDVLADLAVRLKYFNARVDHDRGFVSSSLFGFASRSAFYRPGLGCTLLNETTVEELKEQARGFAPVRPAPVPGQLWPQGGRVDADIVLPGIDAVKLREAVDRTFTEPFDNAQRRTRAVVVVHKGRIIAERYAPGIQPGTPLIGWSMGKSIAAALVGIMVRNGKLDIGKGKLFPQWSSGSDPRADITLDHLLRMTSSLDFDSPHARMLSDVRRMLFLERDAGGYAIAKHIAGAPGITWRYGSGSTNLVSTLIRRGLQDGQRGYFSFPHRALFAPLGMRSAVLEPDASGTYLLPAFIHASARDWARFGLFILNNGVWRGRRILPEGWVEYVKRPTPQSGGLFGAHFWRRVPAFLQPDNPPDYKLPEDRFYMLGHDGQMVAMLPSHDLVVVRLGVSRRRGAWDSDLFLAGLLGAFKGTGEAIPLERDGRDLPAGSSNSQGFNWGRADQLER